MRKFLKAAIILSVIFVLGALFYHFTRPKEPPSDGVWYCEELNMSIDFGLLRDDYYCVKEYHEDGSYSKYAFWYDEGAAMGFSYVETLPNGMMVNTNYRDLSGVFRWKEGEDEFVFTNGLDEFWYVFKKGADPYEK